MDIISPLNVMEGDTGSQAFEITLLLSPNITGVLRDIVYTVSIQEGSATGESRH